jgi:WD40 repeat protein
MEVGQRVRILALGLLAALAGTTADAQEREKLPALKEAYSAPGEKTAAVRFSPDGKTLALGGSASIRILSVADSFKELKRLPQQGLVDELLFDPTGKILLSRSHDEDTLLWETAGWTRLKFALETGPVGVDPKTVPPPDSKDWLPIPDRLKGFRLWRLDGLQEKRRWAGRAQVGDCLGILLDRVTALAGYESRLLVGDEEGHILSVPWEKISLAGPDLRKASPNAAAPKLRSAASARLFRPHTDEISSISVSSDRRFCVSAGRDGKVNLWNPERLPAPGDPPRPPKDLEPQWSLPGYVAELSANGMAVAIADRAGVTVYEVASGKPLSFNPTAQTGGRAVRLRFSPSGSQLAAVICRCGDCAAGETMVSYRKTLLEHGGALVVWK